MQTAREALKRAFATPWPTLSIPILLLPFLLSAAARYCTGLSLFWSLALSIGGLALAVRVVEIPRFERSNFVNSLGTFVSAALLFAWVLRLWWTPNTMGMPNGPLGPDAGNHILLFRAFVHDNPKAYAGFNGTYALVHWYRTFLGSRFSEPLSIFYGFRFAHYAALTTVPVALAMTTYASLSEATSRARQVMSIALSFVVQAALVAFIVFPVLQYFQTDGFYSQVVGVYPLLFGWVLSALVKDRVQRFAICAGSLVVLRFTYGLNLGDSLAAYALIYLFEASRFPKVWLKVLAYAFVAAAAYGAYLVYKDLHAMRMAMGFFTRHDDHPVMVAQILLSLGLISAPELFTHFGIAVQESASRLWRYAGIFGAVSAAMTGLYVINDQPQHYYFLKYSLYPVLVVSIASIGPLSALIDHFLVAPRTRDGKALAPFLTTVFALYVCAFGSLFHGHRAYHEQAKERFERTVPGVQLLSAYEPEVDRFIERLLRTKKAHFGGYYDYFWPRMSVTNTLRGMFKESTPPYHFTYNQGGALFKIRKGNCYFFFGYYNKDYAFVRSKPIGFQIGTFFNDRTECQDIWPRSMDRRSRICAACY